MRIQAAFLSLNALVENEIMKYWSAGRLILKRMLLINQYYILHYSCIPIWANTTIVFIFYQINIGVVNKPKVLFYSYISGQNF